MKKITNYFGKCLVQLCISGLFINSSMAQQNCIVGNGSGTGISGTFCTALGTNSLHSNCHGSYNTALGYQAMLLNDWGNNNTGVGYGALSLNISGTLNTATGSYALWDNSTGIGNTAVGYKTLLTNFTGSYNTTIGYQANVSYSNLNFATAIGWDAISNASKKVVIGANTTGMVIGGYANWSNLSDGRFKENIKNDVPGLAFIKKLLPVTYTIDLEKLDKHLTQLMPDSIAKQYYNSPEEYEASKTIRHTGFVAQAVESAAKEIGYEFDGVNKPTNVTDNYSLSYATFTVPLVRAVQELDKQNQELNTRNEKLENKIITLENRISEMNSCFKSLCAGNPLKSTTENSFAKDVSTLNQNNPNPFKEKTTISFSISSTSNKALLKIFSMDGQEMKSVVISTKGNGQIEFAPNTLGPGVYAYVLIVDDKTIDTKQMVITK